MALDFSQNGLFSTAVLQQASKPATNIDFCVFHFFNEDHSFALFSVTQLKNQLIFNAVLRVAEARVVGPQEQKYYFNRS